MSELMKGVSAQLIGRQRNIMRGPLKIDELLTVKDNFVADTQLAYFSHYEIGVGLRCYIRLPEVVNPLDREKVLNEAVHRVKRQIVDAAFGEFVPYIHGIERALWDYDVALAKKILVDMEKAMFSVEE